MDNAPSRLASCGALGRRRLAGGRERGGDVGAVAIGLVLGLAAATERRPGSDRRAREHDLRVDRQRPVFAHRDGVDLRVGFIGAAIVPGDVDRPGRTIQRHVHERLGACRVRIDPGSFDIRLEHGRLREHASTGVDAKLAVEFDRRRLAGRSFNPSVIFASSLARTLGFTAKWTRAGRSARLRREVNRPPGAAPSDRQANPCRRTMPGKGRPCWRDCGSAGTHRHEAAWRESRPPWRQSRQSAAAG